MTRSASRRLPASEEMANLEHELAYLRLRRDQIIGAFRFIRRVVWAAGAALVAALIAMIAAGREDAAGLLFFAILVSACLALAVRVVSKPGAWVEMFDRAGHLAFLREAIATRERLLEELRRQSPSSR